MTIEFSDVFGVSELSQRVRAVMGVPEEILEDGVISSPTFKIKAERYINKQIGEYKEEDLQDYFDLLNIAYVYYICYLLCTGMYARLPKQMENKSTKTIMESINWDERAMDMLNRCDEVLEDIIAELDDSFKYGNTFAVLTDESSYPNTLV